jgi:hypothetical protein
MFSGSFSAPVMDEGFTSIVQLPFAPKFNDKNEEMQFRMHLLG